MLAIESQELESSANPEEFNSTESLETNQASALYALKLTGVNAANDYINAVFDANATITQTISTGTTATGRLFLITRILEF